MHSTFDEEDLVEIQRGDRAALKRAWDRHADFVFYVAGKFMSSREATEDVVQDVFIKLANGAGSIKDARSLRGWLAVATRNACIDAIRRNKRQIPVQPAEFADMEEKGRSVDASAVSSQDPAVQAEREVELALVGRLMDELGNEPGGEVLVWFYRQGVPVAEIARRRGESVGTVTSRLTRLRAKLRERLLAIVGPEGDGNG